MNTNNHNDSANPKNSNDTAHDHSHPCGCTALDLHLAYRAVAGDLPPDTEEPFPSSAVPGQIDKRVTLQTAYWFDIDAVRHRLSDMTHEHRANVLAFLHTHSDSWIAYSRAITTFDAIIGNTEPTAAAHILALLDALPPGWSQHTPLAHALHRLNATHPDPLALYAHTYATESDRPDTLRDADPGTWQITTGSGTTYLIDLDTRRVMRQPRRPRAHDDPPMSGVTATTLIGDRQWSDLEHLIHCVTGHPLLLLDQHTTHAGYRLSTPIITIRRNQGNKPRNSGNGPR